jgi:threonine dehydrogenase-like Zn-dependent dehydrogenase
MWAQVLDGPFRFEQIEVKAPEAADLRPGQVLLSTRAGAICGSDLPYFRGGMFPHPADLGAPGATRAPGFPLHEVVGRVEASEHPEHAVGDLVVGWASLFDGIAELVVSDGEGLVRYDTSLPASTAVLLQPLACVLYAVEQLDEVAGRTAAVVGQGPIGLLFSHVLKQRGARHVVGIDRVDRHDAAAAFGVDEVVVAPAARWAAALTEAERPALVVEAVGHQVSTMKNCLDAVGFGGEVYYFGVPDDLVYPVDMMTLLRKNLTLRAGVTVERRRVLAEANAYLAAHPDLRESYVSHVYPATDVQQAFAAAGDPKPGQFKIAIEMA